MTVFKVGDRVGRFRLERELGAGGMGKVFEAVDPLLARQVAIKFLHAAGMDPELLMRGLLREGRTVATLKHRHIVQIHEAGIHEGVPYFVMELVRGLSLRTYRDPMAHGCRPHGAWVPTPWRMGTDPIAHVVRTHDPPGRRHHARTSNPRSTTCAYCRRPPRRVAADDGLLPETLGLLVRLRRRSRRRQLV